jgi:hypothetical protein
MGNEAVRGVYPAHPKRMSNRSPLPIDVFAEFFSAKSVKVV